MGQKMAVLGIEGCAPPEHRTAQLSASVGASSLISNNEMDPRLFLNLPISMPNCTNATPMTLPPQCPLLLIDLGATHNVISEAFS
jgi:hypothetical protein